ncbi:Spx/MgsR family RNA polymerase-binding regulatory protein [Leuconostoc carnosum]|uniref:Transcriptional regulator Spx n=2 Tax=Leuconostoc carnosum TaxID=1252 RepID=K0D834_LEUCJ|nr:transcriptional regulator Spx [Leuconostoc carnosum]AFT82094.1 transcriptional regulator Spx [Leuconostoc carnosum JB16]KAA8328661.1 Spx/MgsR family RNA polymerase-binding regulatory protein [Leuconostoc carnosum]QEA33864.1 Spx/MgsR family RNA polymerase-binding regulatory protein [Leuconostoc carnosum]
MVVTLFLSPSCTSCRKARQWLESHNIAYVERNVKKDKLSADEVKAILRLTEDGTEEIISKRSKAFSQLNLDFNTVSTNEFIDLVVQHPSLLKRPIMMDDSRIQVGYNDDDIRQFLPREVRQRELVLATMRSDFQEQTKNLVIEEN